MADNDPILDPQAQQDYVNKLKLPPVLPSLTKPRTASATPSLNMMPPVSQNAPDSFANAQPPTPNAPSMMPKPSPVASLAAMPPSALPPVRSLDPSPAQKAIDTARSTLARDTARPSFTEGVLQKADKYHEAHPGFIGRLGQIGAGLLRGVDIAGETLAPGIAKNIPGSGLYKSAQEARDQAKLTAAQTGAKTEAETAKDLAEADKAKTGGTPKTPFEALQAAHPDWTPEKLIETLKTEEDQKADETPKANFSAGGQLLSVKQKDKDYIPGDETAPPEVQAIFHQAAVNEKTRQMRQDQPLSAADAAQLNANVNRALKANGLPQNPYREGQTKTEVADIMKSTTESLTALKTAQTMASAARKEQDAISDQKARFGTIQNSINEMASPDIIKMFDNPAVVTALSNAVTPQVRNLDLGLVVKGAPIGIRIPSGTLDQLVTRGLISKTDASRLIDRYRIATESAIQFLMLTQGGKIGRGGQALLDPLFNIIPGPLTTSGTQARDQLGLWQDQFDIWKKDHPQYATAVPSYREGGKGMSEQGGGGGGGGGPAAGMTRMTGPGGTFDVPADKVQLYKDNGYK